MARYSKQQTTASRVVYETPRRCSLSHPSGPPPKEWKFNEENKVLSEYKRMDRLDRLANRHPHGLYLDDWPVMVRFFDLGHDLQTNCTYNKDDKMQTKQQSIEGARLVLPRRTKIKRFNFVQPLTTEVADRQKGTPPLQPAGIC